MRSLVPSSTDRRRALVAIWILATGAGATIGASLVLTGLDGLAYVVSLAMVLTVPFVIRGAMRQVAASGLLAGFVLAQLLAAALAPGCLLSDDSCQPQLETIWLFVLAIAIAETLGLLALAADNSTGPPRQPDEQRRFRRRPEAGHSMIRELERKLGMGVVVQSVEAGPPVTIDALLLYGALRHPVVAIGETEAEAWQDLARIVLAWSQSNVTKIPMWWGGGAP
jgi:hypothetical protein